MRLLTSAPDRQASALATTIRGLLNHRAAALGERPALFDPRTGTAVTYRTLRDRAEAVAVGLARRGVVKGDKVVTILGNGAAAIELFLGIQYGGFVATPLNPDAEPRALGQLLEHSDAGAVFAAADVLARLDLPAREPRRTPELIPTDAHGNPLWRESGDGVVTLADVTPDDEAVLDYTSGSSGKPKGVVVTHRNVLASGNIHCRAQEMTSADRALLVLPLCHMNAQHVTLLSTLLSGGSLVVPRRFIPAEFWELIDQYRCTWFAAVPTILEQLLQLAPTAAEAAGCGHLRFARSSAAKLSDTAHRTCERRFGFPIIQAMGMTESGGTFFFNPLPPQLRKYGSVGRPVGYEARVVGESGHVLEAGLRGEIQIRGEPVMKGYYRDEDGTAAVLSKDGWLATGDIGYRDEDGYYFVSGRSKETIKKGGQGIALAEIDEVLKTHPGVSDAATIGVPDALFGEELFAYVVPRATGSTDASELTQFCRARLGAFKSPAGVAFVQELPRSATGKVLRQELLERHRAAAKGVTSGANPPELASETAFRGRERRLVEIWEKVLKVAPVGLNDNFFDLGGSSLAAIDIFLEIERQFGRRLPPSVLFACPSVALLAEKLNSDENEPWSSVVAIKPGGSRPPLFGVYAEDHVLFYFHLAQAMGPEQPFYGVQSLTLKPGAAPPKRLVDLAACYVRDLQRVRPEGPYYLAGQCTGAKIALEMACQLAAAGEQVPLLFILDSSAPHRDPETAGSPASRLGRRIAGSLIHYRERWQDHLRTGDLFHAAVAHVEERLLGSWKRGREFRRLRAGFSSVDLSKMTHGERDAGLRAVRSVWEENYVPKRFPGKIILIRSEEVSKRPGKQAGADRWRVFAAGGLEVQVIPGGHESIFHAPYVERLAEVIGQRIAATGSQARNGETRQARARLQNENCRK